MVHEVIHLSEEILSIFSTEELKAEIISVLKQKICLLCLLWLFAEQIAFETQSWNWNRCLPSAPTCEYYCVAGPSWVELASKRLRNLQSPTQETYPWLTYLRGSVESLCLQSQTLGLYATLSSARSVSSSALPSLQATCRYRSGY